MPLSLLIAAVSSLGWISTTQAQPPGMPVKVDTVALSETAETIPVVGRIVAQDSGLISARTAGAVTQLAVQIGDQVNKGDIIAVLDQVDQKNRLAKARADRQTLLAQQIQADADEKLAMLNLKRAQELEGRPGFTQSLMDSRRAEADIATAKLGELKARLAAADAELQAAKTDLALSTIRAPFAGVITQRRINRGAWVSRGDPVIELVNNQEIEAEANVPSQHARNLRAGQTISLLLANNHATKARVRAVLPQENPTARTRLVRLEPTLPAEQTAVIDSAVTLLIPVGQDGKATTVHKDAVIRGASGASVFVVQEGAAQIRKVELGGAIGSRYVVLQGLSDGDKVVVRGNERLRPGQPVAASPITTPESSGS